MLVEGNATTENQKTKTERNRNMTESEFAFNRAKASINEMIETLKEISERLNEKKDVSEISMQEYFTESWNQFEESVLNLKISSF